MGDENGISAANMLLLLPALKNETLVEDFNAISVENKTLNEIEKEALIKALKQSDNSQVQAAEILGITLRQVGYKMKKYGI
jgi:Nif-specific regulatory protein